MAFIYDLSDTWDSAGITFSGIKLNVTDTGSAADSRLVDLRINGSSKFTVSKTGALTAAGIVESTVGGFKFPDGTTQTTAASGSGGGVTSVSGTGTVSGITLTGTVTSSGSLTLGGTLSVTPSNFASQTANTFLAGPNGTSGTPTFRAIVAADIPTLNQNTTGSAATLTTARTIAMTGDLAWTSAPFDGSGNVTGSATLATVNPNVGTFGSATVIPVVTVNGKGLVTGVTTVAVSGGGVGGGTVTSVSGTGSVNGITLTGTVTSSGSLTLGGTLSGVDLTTQVTGTLPVSSGGTGGGTAGAARTSLGAAASGANTDITSLKQDVAIAATGTIAADSIGFRGLPQNAQTGAYTLALSDAGKQVSNTTGGWVIPANASVAFPVGTAIALYNNSGSNQTISITSDTLRQAGTANTGSRTLAQYGLATCTKVSSTTWVISGAGLS